MIINYILRYYNRTVMSYDILYSTGTVLYSTGIDLVKYCFNSIISIFSSLFIYILIQYIIVFTFLLCTVYTAVLYTVYCIDPGTVVLHSATVPSGTVLYCTVLQYTVYRTVQYCCCGSGLQPVSIRY